MKQHYACYTQDISKVTATFIGGWKSGDSNAYLTPSCRLGQYAPVCASAKITWTFYTAIVTFKKAVFIKKPADCQVHTVIHFLWVKNL